MPNTIQNFKVGFESRYQDIFGKSLTAMKIASTRLDSNLSWGKSVDRPKLVLDAVKVRAISRQTDRTIDNLTDAKETLTIDRQYGASFAIDDWDELQGGPLKAGQVAGREIAMKVKRFVDADVYAKVDSAYDTFDDGDIAGTAGNPITLVPTGASENVIKTFTNLMAKLQGNNQEEGDKVVALDPLAGAALSQCVIGKDITLANNALQNGYSGSIAGFGIYITNNLTGSVVLNMATNPTANDTVTYNGVVFKFVTPIGATAGNVLIGADAAASRANLIAAINGAAGAGSTYIELSAADRNKISEDARLTASGTGTTIVVKGVGSGRLVVSETLTHAADIFSKNKVHSYAGRKGGIDLVMQQGVTTTFRDEPKQRTTNVLIDALYGLQVFEDSKQRFLDLQIAA